MLQSNFNRRKHRPTYFPKKYKIVQFNQTGQKLMPTLAFSHEVFAYGFTI